MVRSFLFTTTRTYFTELFFSNNLLLKNNRCALAVAASTLIPFNQLFLEFIRYRQQIFFVSGTSEMTAALRLGKTFSAMYLEQRANLWALSNRNILTDRNLLLGLEARLRPAAGLIINTSAAFTSRLPFRYLWRTDNLIASVNLIRTADFTLFAGTSGVTDALLLTFFFKLARHYTGNSPYYLRSLALSNAKKNLFVSQKISSLKRPKFRTI